MMWNFKEFSNKIAATDEYGTSISYGTLADIGAEVAASVGGRCLVFSLCTNTIGSIIGYTAFLNHRIVPLLLNAHLEKELLKNLMDTYSPKYIWVPEDMADNFRDCSCAFSGYGYVLLKPSYSTEYPLFDKLGLLLTTSGSTGSPKFVRQSYENVLANAKSIVQYLELDWTERPITTLPMNYTYGLSIINSHLLVGATLMLTEKTLMQKPFWDFLKKSKATSFGGVPYTYEILDKLRFFQMDLPDLKTMTQAGGKLIPELHKKFAEYAAEKGKRFFVMYGQCEATARMAYLPYAVSVEKYGSMGIAIPGGKLSIIDEDGKPIDEPEISGELVYEGSNVTLGYAECGEDLAKGDERFGRLVTGDMAKRDADGFYYIVGRKKRFLKIYGNRVNLDEVDRLIKNHFDNTDCASTGIDDHMYIFITDASLQENIRKFISEKTGLNQVSFHVTVINEIPKSDAGKIQYNELKKYYSN